LTFVHVNRIVGVGSSYSVCYFPNSLFSSVIHFNVHVGVVML